MTTETTRTPKTAGELTLAELLTLLRETVTESLAEIVGYPDEEQEPCQGATADNDKDPGAGAGESKPAYPATSSRIQIVTDEAALSAKLARKLGDMTVADFRFWIHQIVGEVGEDLIGDPDEGLEFTEEFAASILEASAEVAAGNTIPAEEVYRRLGLD